MKFKVERQNNHACFLKPDISVNNNIFVYKLFDKIDTFPFIIVWIPHIDSSIPQDIFHLAIKGGFLRILRSAIFFDDFTPKGKELINRIESQTSKSIPTKRSLWKKHFFTTFSPLFHLLWCLNKYFNKKYFFLFTYHNVYIHKLRNYDAFE